LDKVLLIDGANFMWRANVRFGPPVQHQICQLCTVDFQKNRHPVSTHCECGSPWSETESFCYGNKYLIVYNFFKNLRPIIELFSPDKCFFVLEGHPQFRYDLFAGYKANRIIKMASKQETKDFFFESRDIILPLLACLPITQCRAAEYECDDVIATLCENMKDEDLTVLSNDNDYIQLLQRGYNNIKIYNPITKTNLVAPDYPYVAWKCLNGDKSDNIPGLLKPKKAIDAASNPDLFKKFMDVEENRANFNINRQLIEFRNVPEEEILLVEGVRDFPKLKDAFTSMKFESIVNDKSWQKYCNTFNCLKY
jgi:5'-3' exonuclease